MTRTTPLAPGDSLPSFALAAHDGQQITRESLLGRPLVLWFYPRNATPGCTLEALEFRSHWSDFEAMGVAVVGVSPDRQISHARCVATLRLPYLLLADPEHVLADACGVMGDKVLFGRRYRGLIRSTFLCDAAGVVREVFSPVRPRGHAATVLERARVLAGHHVD